ncbi:MAG: cyclase family protein [Clostridiales bacterium]|nr:cyclase family protein [Clostridiales bacterium]
MKVIDVTGTIRNGMWSFGSLFPQPYIEEASGYCEGFGEYFYTQIKGMHAQVGTYIETPAHFYGFENSYLVDDIPIEKLTDVGCVVLKVEKDILDTGSKAVITKEDLVNAKNSAYIQPGDCVVVHCGWERYWMRDDIFFPRSPYFTSEAMHWIIEKQPSILATDTPAWENLGEDPEGFFPDFYAANILMLVPLCNLDAVTKPRVKLTALPLKVEGVAASPCRVIIKEDA